VAAEHRAEPAQVAHGDRVVHPERPAQVRRHLRRNVGVRDDLAERIARREREHGEQDDADPEQARDGDQHPSRDVRAGESHLTPPTLAASSANSAAALPPEGAQFAPWGGPAARMTAPTLAAVTFRDTSPAKPRNRCPSRSPAPEASNWKRARAAA